MALAVCSRVRTRTQGRQNLGVLEAGWRDVMSFSPCGAWMAADVPVCAHARQGLVLGSSCDRSGLGCRAMQIEGWLRGLGLGQYDATFGRRDGQRLLLTLKVVDLKKRWWAYAVRVWRTMSHVITQSKQSSHGGDHADGPQARLSELVS